MTARLTKASRSNFVPLRDATLCLECEFITPGENDRCSICGSDKLVRLAELLDVLIGKACDAKQPIPITDLVRMMPMDKLRLH